MDEREAAADAKVIKTLFRKGSMTEGVLASWVRENLTSDTWKACTARLIEWGIVEVTSSYRGSSRTLTLTRVGSHWGLHFTCAEQQAAPTPGEKTLQRFIEEQKASKAKQA